MDDEAAISEAGGRSNLTVEEIGRLSREEFEALPQAVKARFFELMDRENFPSPTEFYGYLDELDRETE